MNLELKDKVSKSICDNVVKKHIQLGSILRSKDKRLAVLGMTKGTNDTVYLYVKNESTGKIALLNIEKLKEYKVVGQRELYQVELKKYWTYRNIFLKLVYYAEFYTNLKVGSLIHFGNETRPQLVINMNPLVVFLCDLQVIPTEEELRVFLNENKEKFMTNLMIINSYDMYYNNIGKVVAIYNKKVIDNYVMKLKLHHGDLLRYTINYNILREMQKYVHLYK